VQHSQNQYGIARYALADYEGRPIYDQLPGSFDSSKPAGMRVDDQSFNLGFDFIPDSERCFRIVERNIINDLLKIRTVGGGSA
jgi:hypothetical protein